MNHYMQIGAALLAFLVVSGFLALGLWDVPGPTNTVETELDGSRFPR